MRTYVQKELSQRLRPQLEAALAANDDPAGKPFSPDAASAARRAMKNKALQRCDDNDNDTSAMTTTTTAGSGAGLETSSMTLCLV